MQLDTKHEAASNLVEAGQVIKKEDGNGTQALGECAFSCSAHILYGSSDSGSSGGWCVLCPAQSGNLCNLEFLSSALSWT